MKNALIGIVLITLGISLILFFPLAILWALNVLGLTIAIDWQTWLAVLVLMMLIPRPSFKKND
jgi:hypothetical protein